MNTVSSPSAGNDRALDAMESLGAVNISKATGTGAGKLSLQPPF